MSKNQYSREDFKIIINIAWIAGLFILDVLITSLAVRIWPFSRHSLLYSFLFFVLILFAQIPIQWKTLHRWFPSEKSYYYVVVITFTVIAATIGFLTLFLLILAYALFFRGIHEDRSDLIHFALQIPKLIKI